MKKACIITFLLVLCLPVIAAAESMILKTYYPAPFGAYDSLRLVPKVSGQDYTGSCDGLQGTVYVNSSGKLQFCQWDGTWGPLAVSTAGVDPFEQTGDDIYPVDTTTNASLKVGIGTITPQVPFVVSDPGITVDSGVWRNDDFALVAQDPTFHLVGLKESAGLSAILFTEVVPVTGAFNNVWRFGRMTSDPLLRSMFYLSATDETLWSGRGEYHRLRIEKDGRMTLGVDKVTGEMVPTDTLPEAQVHIRGDAELVLEDTSETLTFLDSDAGAADFMIANWGIDQLHFLLKGTPGKDLMNLDINGRLRVGSGWTASGAGPFRLSLIDTPSNVPDFGVEGNHDGGLLALGTFGSGTVLPAVTHDARFIWYPRKAALRAGRVTGTEWDDVNIGDYSVAMGYRTKASKTGTVALGYNVTEATADHAVAIGHAAQATALDAVALGGGYDALASGVTSTAMGRETKATAEAATAMGYLAEANAEAATAMGYNTRANGDYSTATGNATQAIGESSFSMGKQTKATGQQSLATGYAVEARGTRSIAMALDVNQSGVFVDQDSTMAILGGKVGIGTVTPSSRLAVKGLTGQDLPDYVKVNAAGGFYWAGSSRRFKKDIQPLKDDFAKILDIQPVSFTDKNSGKRAIGLIAEDVDALGLRNLVIYGEDGVINGVEYDKIPLYLLEVMKDQQNRIGRLKDEVSQLKEQVCQRYPDAEACQ